MKTDKAFEIIQSLGRINPCNIPLAPTLSIKETYATSAKIAFSEQTKADTPKCSEFKIEILQKRVDEEKKWEIAMIVDDGSNECMLRDLLPSTCYFVRVCAQNENGWGCHCKTVQLWTINLSRVGKRMIYLCPTAKYQNKLSEYYTTYFTKWKGFHITIGGRHCAGQHNLSSAELIQELSELGKKKSSDKALWRIPNGKWRVLGGKDLIVLGLDDDISIFNVAANFLKGKGWTNVKSSFHITLGLKQDLNREQIKEMAKILVDREDPVEWEWVSVTERQDGKLIWDQRFPAYDL